MESIDDSVQSSGFPQRKASLRRWASKERLLTTNAANHGLKSRLTPETSPMSPHSEPRQPSKKEPLMRVRTDGKLAFPAWPALKSSSPRADKAATADTITSSEEPSPTIKSSSFGIRNMLPSANWSAKKKEAVQARRKPSVSDVSSSHMTTVQELCLDSPTIPGHPPGRPLHPGIERSLSVPDHTLHRLSEEVNDRTPRASEFPSLDDSKVTSHTTRAEFSSKDLEKESKSLAPKDLQPLIIPGDSERANEIDVQMELPPDVPPKSPRTESRASSRAKKPPHSANSSVSTLNSVTSSSSSHSFRDNWSMRPLQLSHRNEVPPNSLQGLENVINTTSSTRTERSSSHPRSIENTTPRTPPTPWTRNGRSQSPSVPTAPHSRKQSSSPTKGSELTEPLPSNLSAGHQREPSEPLAFQDVSQPVSKGGDTTSIHGLMKKIDNVPEYYYESVDLPCGYKPTDAVKEILETEAKALKKQAVRHAENFEVLQMKDVTILSQELELLDERCEYLRSTYKSLRQGRKNLHTRMIAYLRSPRMANFSRESILKQEEALAELDISIDDWVAKLEAAEERKTTIRQKLLQHVAAALTLPTISMHRPTYYDEPTPPVSPEKAGDYFSSKRKDVESIRIYADEGVAALLEEIEREIGFIAEPSKPT